MAEALTSALVYAMPSECVVGRVTLPVRVARYHVHNECAAPMAFGEVLSLIKHVSIYPSIHPLVNISSTLYTTIIGGALLAKCSFPSLAIGVASGIRINHKL